MKIEESKLSKKNQIRKNLAKIKDFIDDGFSISTIYHEFVVKELNSDINKKYFYEVLNKLLKEEVKKPHKEPHKASLKDEAIQPYRLDKKVPEIALKKAENTGINDTTKRELNSTQTLEYLMSTDVGRQYEENYKKAYGNYWWFKKGLDIYDKKKAIEDMLNELSAEEHIERYNKFLEVLSQNLPENQDLTQGMLYSKMYFNKMPIREFFEREFNDMSMQSRAYAFIRKAENLLKEK